MSYSANEERSKEGIAPVGPVGRFAQIHRFTVSDLSLLMPRRWATVNAWYRGRTSPTLDDALKLVRVARDAGRVNAQLNDFDPEQKAAA